MLFTGTKPTIEFRFWPTVAALEVMLKWFLILRMSKRAPFALFISATLTTAVRNNQAPQHLAHSNTFTLDCGATQCGVRSSRRHRCFLCKTAVLGPADFTPGRLCRDGNVLVLKLELTSWRAIYWNRWMPKWETTPFMLFFVFSSRQFLQSSFLPSCLET